MPGRDPQSAERSARVGKAIGEEMRRKGLTGVELRKRVEALRGEPVSTSERGREVWLSRRKLGLVNLVQPEKVIYGPTPDLIDIARALDIDPKRLVRAANTPADKKTDQPDTDTSTDSAH